MDLQSLGLAEFVAIAGAILAGAGIWIAFDGMTRPRRRTAASTSYLNEGVEVRIQRERLPISADQFLIQGAAVGAGLAAMSVIATTAWGAVVPMFLCGFAVVWAVYEGKRDELDMAYNAGVALAAQQIANAWLAQPSLSNAMQAVVEYGKPQALCDDFAGVIAAMRGGRPMGEAFQEVADKRRSPFLDGLLMALVSADRQTGDIQHLLEGVAESTRDQVETFRDYVIQSKGARQEILWATFAPWGLVLISRLGTAFVAGSSTGMGLEAFFATPLGSILLAMAGVATLTGYWQMQKAAQEGIVLERIETEDVS